MLSAIITKLTGEPLLDYLRPRLFDLLGIENPTWETDPRGVNIGGSGLHIKTEDIARFGQMYLQKGMWDGKRILTAGMGRRGDERPLRQQQHPDQPRLDGRVRLPVLALPARLLPWRRRLRPILHRHA